MKPPFLMVTDAMSHDTIEMLEQLLEEARSGRVIGVVFCAMYRRHKFIANTSGEAFRNPVFARGMVASLDDHLSNQVRQA